MSHWTDEKIIEVVGGFRDGILDEDPSDGRCMMVCAPLVGYLNFLGLHCQLAKSNVLFDMGGSCEHFWIQMPDGRVLDPTADQFNDEFPKAAMPKVYLGAPVAKIHKAMIQRRRK